MFCKNFRVLAWLLTLCTLTPAVVSCGGDGGTAADDTQAKETIPVETGAETVPPDPLEARKLVDDELGEHDLGGYEFRIFTTDNKSETLDCDASTGDVIDDAVYARNNAVEERFNCTISIAKDALYNDITPYVTKTLSSGEDAFDIASAHVVKLGELTLSDYFMNWYDIPHIDFSKPWWSDSTVNDLTYKGVCVTAIGDMALSAMSAAYCVFYNKELGANYDFPDLYDAVNTGKWTIDYMTTLTKDIYNDLNANGAVDIEDDLFGYLSDCASNLNTYLWAFDNPVFRKNGDKLEYVYKTDKLVSIISTLCDTFNLYDGIKCSTTYVNADGNAHNYSRDMFAKGHAVLANGYISMSLSHFRELEDEFGILPYPKWDETQEHYITMSDGHHEALAIPRTATNWEAIGIITEAMCAESYKTLVPAYYDVALKVKSTRDEESIAMLDLIVDSRIFDFGYVYDAWKGSSFFMQTLVSQNDTNFESFYAKKEKAVTDYYNKVIEYFENYEA